MAFQNTLTYGLPNCIQKFCTCHGSTSDFLIIISASVLTLLPWFTLLITSWLKHLSTGLFNMLCFTRSMPDCLFPLPQLLSSLFPCQISWVTDQCLFLTCCLNLPLVSVSLLLLFLYLDFGHQIWILDSGFVLKDWMRIFEFGYMNVNWISGLWLWILEGFLITLCVRLE